MQEEERKKKECLYCGNFEGYYTKALRCFERTKQGYCRELDKIVNNQDSCEFWKPNRIAINLDKVFCSGKRNILPNPRKRGPLGKASPCGKSRGVA